MALAEEQRVKEAKERQRQRQGDYAKLLEAQVTQRRQVARVTQGMSEYERRVNENALNNGS